ncbi:hypothetical protein Tco_0388728 [Tanacetum coccineum]
MTLGHHDEEEVIEDQIPTTYIIQASDHRQHSSLNSSTLNPRQYHTTTVSLNKARRRHSLSRTHVHIALNISLTLRAIERLRAITDLHSVLIIKAQQHHAADVHPDKLCPPNKRYDLMDANKKVDLEHVQCPPESKILTNIIKNHPLRFSIAASSSVLVGSRLTLPLHITQHESN